MSLVFTTADNFPYPLRAISINDGVDSGHPGRIWTNQSSSSHDPVSIVLPATLRIETDILNGSRVWVNDRFAGRFEVFVFGGRNTLFSWSQMALVAPLDKVQGGIDGMVLEAGVGIRNAGHGNPTVPPMSNGATSCKRYGVSILAVVFGLVVLQLFV